MAWIVAVVLFVEAVAVVALNWILAVVVDRQDMSLAGLDPGVMVTSSEIGGVVLAVYFALCGLVALLVAIRDRAPSGLGRALLVSVAVVHGLLGAVVWGLLGVGAFLLMVFVLALVVLLLMTHDGLPGPAQPAGGGDPGDGGGAPRAVDGPRAGAGEPATGTGDPAAGAGRPRDAAEPEPQDDVPASAASGVTAWAPTTP
ncbi:hypothetical protein ACWD5R_02450 [Streptomyces sp. NPDC002514]|uniref:hypothetical protein n=1 Tax=Streptomyces sp. NPDC001270 TaxID=3364554 RepID=UPI0036A52EBA